MVEMVSGLMTAAKVAGYIASYRSYKFEQRKEDDKAIRSWLLVKLNDCRASCSIPWKPRTMRISATIPARLLTR